MATRYIVVVSKDPLRTVKSYLYSHTTVVGVQSFELAFVGLRTYVLLKTEADTEERAQYLAEYQAARLQSGMLISLVEETRESAERALWEHYEVVVEDVEA